MKNPFFMENYGENKRKNLDFVSKNEKIEAGEAQAQNNGETPESVYNGSAV